MHCGDSLNERIIQVLVNNYPIYQSANLPICQMSDGKLPKVVRGCVGMNAGTELFAAGGPAGDEIYVAMIRNGWWLYVSLYVRRSQARRSHKKQARRSKQESSHKSQVTKAIKQASNMHHDDACHTSSPTHDEQTNTHTKRQTNKQTNNTGRKNNVTAYIARQEKKKQESFHRFTQQD